MTDMGGETNKIVAPPQKNISIPKLLQTLQDIKVQVSEIGQYDLSKEQQDRIAATGCPIVPATPLNLVYLTNLVNEWISAPRSDPSIDYTHASNAPKKILGLDCTLSEFLRRRFQPNQHEKKIFTVRGMTNPGESPTNDTTSDSSGQEEAEFEICDSQIHLPIRTFIDDLERILISEEVKSLEDDTVITQEGYNVIVASGTTVVPKTMFALREMRNWVSLWHKAPKAYAQQTEDAYESAVVKCIHGMKMDLLTYLQWRCRNNLDGSLYLKRCEFFNLGNRHKKPIDLVPPPSPPPNNNRDVTPVAQSASDLLRLIKKILEKGYDAERRQQAIVDQDWNSFIESGCPLSVNTVAHVLLLQQWTFEWSQSQAVTPLSQRKMSDLWAYIGTQNSKLRFIPEDENQNRRMKLLTDN